MHAPAGSPPAGRWRRAIQFQRCRKLDALALGGTREVAWKTITAAGLKPYFDILVSSQDVRLHKPAPDTFLECARLMHVEPAACQVFEDADMGIRAAVNAGMIPCDIRLHVTRA